MPGTEDFDSQSLTVSVSETQRSDCVQIAIVADTVDEPDEVFNVRLTSSTPGVGVVQDANFREVTISEMSELYIK